MKISSLVVVSFDMLHIEFLAVSARPGVDGGNRFISDGGHVCQLFCNMGFIAVGEDNEEKNSR